MEFDTVLTRAAGSDILSEVVALTSHRTVRATGVSQSGTNHYQFQAELDLPAREWHMITSAQAEYAFRGGVLSLAPDPPRETAFPRGMLHPLQMLYPDQLYIWGRRNDSFHSILAQRIGDHSILLTFEHGEDPAFRSTMVIDCEIGVIRKTATLGDVTILTDVAVDQPMMRSTEVTFPPITDWIRIDY